MEQVYQRGHTPFSIVSKPGDFCVNSELLQRDQAIILGKCLQKLIAFLCQASSESHVQRLQATAVGGDLYHEIEKYRTGGKSREEAGKFDGFEIRAL